MALRVGLARSAAVAVAVVLYFVSGAAPALASAPEPSSTSVPTESGALPVPQPLVAADYVLVRKSERRLYLMREGRVLRSYPVRLGLNPAGH